MPARARTRVAVLAMATLATLAARDATVGEDARAATGGITVRLPPAAADDLTARSSFVLAVPRGHQATNVVEVGNTSSRYVRIAVSPQEGRTGQTSGVVYGARRRGAAGWLTPSVRRLRLAPGASANVGFVVRVPSGAGAGDHLAGLSFRDLAPRSGRGSFAVTQVVRTVVGVLVTVPGPARFVPRLGAARLRNVGTPPRGQVTIRIANRGGRIGRPLLVVRIRRRSTGARQVVRRRLDALLPHSSIALPLAWPRRFARDSYEISVALQPAQRRDVRSNP